MTFLPIVERELRVGARRKYTWWSRPTAAGLALTLFCLLYLLGVVSRGAAFSKGAEQFAVLKWMAFVFAAATGVFLTSDSLSEEKREGTLGLLFLTDLRGHDVVLGKLLSTSLQAVFGLLAAFPVMALTLLLGGVTGFEFWRAILTICNTLFLSLSVGLAVSSMSRDAIKAMNGTLLLGGFILGGLPLLDLALAGFDSTYFQARLSLASPAWLFSTSGMSLPPHYWLAVGIQHALGWGLLAWASFFTPRAWQEKTTGSDRARAGLAERWRFGAASARAALRRRLLDRNPVLWLVLRDRWLRRLVWVVVLASSIELAWMATHAKDFAPIVTAPPKPVTITTTNSSGSATMVTTVVTPGWRIAFQSTQGLLMLGLSLWVASQAARFFVEGVRNGALELILVTPVTPWDVVRAQTTALFRTFLVPAVFMLLMLAANGLISIVETRAAMTAAGSAAMAGFNMVDYEVAALVSGLITFVTGLLSLGAFGMWMGMTNRKTSIAVLKTYCFVSLLPGIALAFAQGFLTIFIALSGSAGSLRFGAGGLPWWLSIAVVTVIHVAKDAFFVVWSRHKLLLDFRDAVGQTGRALPAVMLEPPPIMAAAPPVVTASLPVVGTAPPAPPVSDVTETPV